MAATDQTQQSRDGIGSAGLPQQADSMLASQLVGDAPVPDIIDATTQVYIIFDGAWFESIPSALTLQKYLLAVKIALCSVSAAPLSFSRRGWRQGDCLC
jgi:hypothetical protein